MAEPNPINQNTEPITPNVMVFNGQQVDVNAILNETKNKPEFNVAATKSLVGTSFSKEALDLQQQSYEQIYEDLRTKAVEKQYDGLFSTWGKTTSSLFSHFGAGVLDMVSIVTDPGDIRLPSIGGSIDYVTGLLGEEFQTDIKKYSDWVDPLAYLNETFKFVDNHIWGDGEDEFGNFWTRNAAGLREWSNNVNNVEYKSPYLNWLSTTYNYGPQIFGSVASTLVGGGAIAAAVKGLGRLSAVTRGLNAVQQGVRAEAAAGTLVGKAKQTLNTLGGALLMTESTGMSIAQGVYDTTYQNKLYSLSPNLEGAAQAAYEKAKQEALDSGSGVGAATSAAMKAKKDYIQNFANENPDMHTSAAKSAGKGADLTLKAMAPAFLLNLTMSSALVKTFIGGGAKNAVTRNIISKSPLKRRAAFFEGGQEFVEEGVVEGLAEDMGMAAGAGVDYTISDAWKKTMSWETVTSGLMGFGVAGTLSLSMDFLNRKDHKEKYEKQQEYIKKWNEIGAAAGQPDIVQQLTAPIQSAKELNNVLRRVKQLESQGKVEEAKAESKKILALQAYDAYQSGTTKVLIENWQKIADDDTLKPEVRQTANMAIKEIVAMENDFNESLKYENGRSVFQNRINQKQDTKLAEELKSQIFTKRTEAQLEVALLRQAGKLDLSYDEEIEQQTEVEWNEDGTVKEVVTPVKTEKKELFLELPAKGYTNTIEGVDFSKQFEQIKKEVKPYQEFLDLNEELEATEIRVAEANVEYAKMTAKENQKNLKYQNMILQEYESMKGDLVNSFGTDEYMREVDSKILNHYKNKMDPKAFETFRQSVFVTPSNLEKATREIAEQIQLEEGLKKPEKPTATDDKPKAEVPFTNIPKQSKIEIVARKLLAGHPLTAEEERFKNSNSIKVENKRQDIEKTKKNEQLSTTVTPEVVSEEGTTTDEKAGIAQNINNIIEAEPKPNPKAPEIKIESKVDTIIKSTNANLNEQQREALEKELNKEKPNVAVVGKLLGDIKKPVAQQIINEYKLNQEAVENNTDVELINFANDLKKQIETSGQNVITFDLDTDDDGNLTEVGKKQLELIKRVQASNNTELSIVPNKSVKNRYKIALPISNEPKEDSDAAIDDDLKSFDPKEVDERLSPEAKNQLKEQVGDYLIALEDELGSEPTFEKFIRDYIVNSNKEQAKILFDTLALGWQLNGMPIENYKEIYDKVFRSRKEIANSLMQFAEQQKLVQQQSTTQQVNSVNLESNTKSKPVETASGETVMVPIPLGDTVFRLAYNSTASSARLVRIEDEDGNLVTRIEEFEDDSPDNFLKHKKLLNRDKFNPGTQLSVQVPTDNLDEIRIKDRDANGKVKEVNGKPVLISFKEWLAKNVKEKGIDFLKSQAYYDNVPLIVRDSDGDFVAYVHDISKIELNNELSPEQRAKQIADIRALRKYLIDTEAKGGEPKIEITEKTGGMTELYADGQAKKVRSINNKAVLAKGIVDNNGKLTHVYVSVGGKAEIMTADAFYEKYKISDDNRNRTRKQLQKGNTADIREWSEGGEHKIFTTDTPKLSEEIVESIMNVLTIGMSEGNKSKLQTNLKKKFGSGDLDNYLKKFIVISNPDRVQEGKSYFEVKNFGKGPIMFGVKGGEEIVITTEADLNKYKEQLIDFLSKQNLNAKNKLNTDKPNLQSSDFKMGLVEEDGSIIDSPFDYFEYSMKDAENKIRLENIGTAENPHFITKFQPNIEFKPVAPPNRNSNNYSSPKTETKEGNKQLNNLVASTYTDEQLKKELPNLEAQGFEFIGDTIDEKIADVKKLLSENTNESTELAKQLDENLKEKLEQKAKTNEQEVERLRAEEQVELLEAIPELESYKVDGEIDENLMSDEVKEKYNKIYDKYNSLITPLLSKETEISQEEYNNFIDKGIVSQEIINSIANKIKNNQQLSQQEIAIFTNKTSEINKRLAELKTKETATPLEGFEEFFNIFAESSNVDEAIQKLIDNKTITKDCK